MIIYSQETNVNHCQKAFLILNDTQLQKMNRFYGSDETEYPALYVDMFGMPVITKLSEQQLSDAGYCIINI